MGKFNKTRKYIRNFLMVLLFAAAQVVTAVGPLFQPATASAAPICVNDTAGANDEPGQKDLTKLCVDYAGVPTTVSTTWNWDETGTSGANTMDACNLFDTDGDGNINYSVCVTTEDDPAVLQTLTTYSCGDDKIDRCTSPASVVSSGTTSCTVTQQNTDPFPTGTSSPKDTQGACTIQLSTVGGASAKLIDVCSYPSAQPNSDPSDCVIARNDFGKVELVKDLIPGTDSGLFNLTINGPEANDTTTVNNVGDGGTTGEVVVKKGTVVVSETAGTNTSLSGYTTSVVCKDLNGTGSALTLSDTVLTGSTRSTSFTLAEDADVVCTITNTASSSITIIKDAVPNHSQNFGFTTTGSGLSSFSLDDDSDPTLSNTKTFNNLGAGSYSVTETATSGWDLYSVDCGQATGVNINGSTVSVNLAAGQNITCTYTNKKRGTITVHKITDPANDPTTFSITATGSGNIAGNATRDLSTAQDVVYDVSQGTYDVSEQVPSGWSLTSNDCEDVVVNTSDLNPTCTITNTKLAKLKIVKDALPNDAQNFSFITSGTGLTNFSLDDDSDPALSNQKQFVDLAPGTYSVTESSTPGWALTGKTCDGEFGGTNATVTVELSAGEEVVCTFTNTKLGSISGTKYTANADSSLGPVLDGWTIFIDLNGNGVKDDDEPSDVTDGNGDYSFDDLLPDTYTLLEILQDGWTQIFGPADVELTAGENSTGNDFGNFENATISGYKWNDEDGDGTKNGNETKLSGWTITLYNDNNDQDSDLNNQVAQTVTDGNGNYSFGNLAPGTYAVCETAQAGWTQTYPANNGCHTLVINVSGEIETGNFGNQGRGTIKVKKNVDTDGDGDIDTYNATDWTWDISGGAQDTATGSSQNVAAGNYTVSEDQKTNYHVTDVSCSGEQINDISESVSVTVSPGEDVVCTFTNTRDTGNITVHKTTDPNTDETFSIVLRDSNQAEVHTSTLGNGDSDSYDVVTGTYSLDEENIPSDWDLKSAYCENQDEDGLDLANLVVESDDDIDCYFHNEQRGQVIVTKFNDLNRNGYKDDNEDVLPNWTINLEAEDDCSLTALSVSLACYSYDKSQTTNSNGETTFTGVKSDEDHVLSEDVQTGWHWSNTYCEYKERYTGSAYGENYYVLSIEPGETLECFIGNYPDPNLTISKSNNRPEPTTTGDTVTFTIKVSLAKSSGAVFDAVVYDTPPAGFTYVPGSWTSTSPETTDPLFNPVGVWQLGDLYPGDEVTLTYQAKIDDSVEPGTYENVAYLGGCLENRRIIDEQYIESLIDQLPSGCEDSYKTEEVRSKVTVYEPQILGEAAVDELVVTGVSDIWRSISMSLVLIAAALIAMLWRPAKAGKK